MKRNRQLSIILSFLCLSFLPVLSQDPTTPLRNLSDQLANKDFRSAISIADSLISSGTQDYKAFYLAGLAYGSLMKFDQARMLLMRADSLNPNQKPVLSNLSDCCYELSKLSEAEKITSSLISLDSTDPAGWLQLARIYVRQGKQMQAIQIYRSLWQSDSLNLWFPRQIGNLLIRNDRYQEAVPVLELVVESDSSDIESYVRLGLGYLKLGLVDKTTVLDKAIRQDSMVPLLYQYRGGLHLTSGVSSLAEADFQKAVNLGDSSAFTLRHLGISQFQQSKYDQALNAFAATVKLDSTDVQAWYYLGFCYKWNQDLAKAIEYLQLAVKIAIPPFTAGIFPGLGQFYSLNRDFKTATEYYEKALEFNPADPVPYAQIGLLIEESFGDRAKAKEYYERFIKEYKGMDRNLVRYVNGRITAINERLFMEGKLKK